MKVQDEQEKKLKEITDQKKQDKKLKEITDH